MSCAGLNQVTSTFWPVTLQPLGADHATIPHMKGDCYTFHMRYTSMICYKRLQSDRLFVRLPKSPLVFIGFQREYAEIIKTIGLRLRELVLRKEEARTWNLATYVPYP